MSFNSHKRKVLDESEPLEHRASHARSCALHVANTLALERDAVIELVAKETGVSLHSAESAAHLMAAFEALERIRVQAVQANA
ncbi:hypothetical protein GCM10009304_09030 [Pseudomonas matsuisoli]|uniref:Uncharacterized protein n=1 Tax=Pseudomonas matsuisoli TaxID=1515666 RepID=A0A917PNQ7_9PSED|nr:hypothetical protein GCM10009304_09030 [Pseudomonas matsuisoli]